ncbi:TolC family outer membrane protein [Thiorhodovibrio frisius]|uniref:Type I secretion outer membrane protein, TolC family n=1 Tax=Thiorhodovibrio frisius TaxID=631362 RepID=H8YYK1_9GAMM|nr:TolC family outer membrane protein [Thiorhodovibrio frisius]EIC23527.1 type I secretion outer membrane protein, TolC family [Thiorhodovibrio frisius]WPL23386.1 Outer membrane protein TolC precursor [Thiorhodovibrio frisius]
MSKPITAARSAASLFGFARARLFPRQVSGVVLLGALCLLPGAQAADLLTIYDLATNSDPTLRESEQTFYAARENKPQAQALLLPNFSLSGNVQYNQVKTENNYSNLSGFGAGTDTYQTSGAGAQLSQSVYNRANWVQLSQADNTIAQAEAQYQAAQIDLMVRTTEAYFDVLRANDAVRVQKALETANARQLEQSQQRFDVGLVAITDVNESQAAYDRSRANLISAKNELDNRWEALRRIIGPVSLPLARLGDRLPLAPPEPNDINAWAETALARNFNVIAAQQAAESARKGIEVERSAYYPSVDLQAGYDITRSGAEFGSDIDSGYVGLNLTVPIYQGGAVASRTRQAGYNFRAAQDRLDQQRRAVINQVNDAFRGILSSISDVKARQAAIVSARSALESTQAGLEVGTRTQVDVLNAQQNLFQAEFEYLSARYDYIINGVLLHQATSTLNREVLAMGNAWLNQKDLVQPPAY